MTRRVIAACSAALVVVAALGAGAGAASAEKRAATVELRAVLAMVPPESVVSSTLAPADRADAAAKVASCDQAAVAQVPAVPTTKWRTATRDQCVVYPDRDGQTRYLLGPAKVTTSDVRRANAQFRSGQGWTVRLALTRRGSEAWDALAQQQFHRQVAMAARGEVLAAPIIQPNDQTFTSFDGVAVVSSDFTRKQARGVAALAGARNGR